MQPEHLTPLAPVVELRPRWQSPWVLLATAAVLMLVLGVVFQGIGGRQRSDDTIAPKPDAPQVELELPADVGRDWEPDDISTPARLDLDGDGTKEKVEFLAEPTKEFDGRIRLQTTLSSTGEEAYGMVELGTTIGISALDPIDADGDGDQELVLYDDRRGRWAGRAVRTARLRPARRAAGPGGARGPRAARARGRRGARAARRATTTWCTSRRTASRAATLVSSRSVNAFARAIGGMTLMRPESYVLDTWAVDASTTTVSCVRGTPGCLVQVPDGQRRPATPTAPTPSRT